MSFDNESNEFDELELTYQNPPAADLPISRRRRRRRPHRCPPARSLQSSTTATSLSARAVSRHGGDVLDSADLHAGTRESTQRRLSAGARSARTNAASGAETNVKGVDAWDDKGKD